MSTTTTATLNYVVPPKAGVKSFQWISSPPAGTPSTNVVVDARRVEVHDVRSLPSDARPTLEANGVQFLLDRPSRERAFADDDEIRAVYYPEVEALLKEVTGASRVVIFDHTIRRAPTVEGEIDDPQHRKPVSAVHIDQTPQAGEARVRRHLPPAEAEALLAKRNQIINVWRPFGLDSVEDLPLAVADRTTVAEEDKIPTDLISAEYANGETFGVAYSPSHKWLYLAHQTPDEVTLLKCYDSTEPTAVVPHTAFANEDARPGAPKRQSIEVRTLVFYDA